MEPDLPTGSITGQRGWRWNQRQAEREGTNATRTSVDEPTDEHRRSETALRRDVRALELELERKEDRLRYVIEHYERLLTEKDRQLSNQNRESPSPDRSPSIVSTIRQIADRR